MMVCNKSVISAIQHWVPSQVFPSTARLSPSEHEHFAPNGVSKQSWLHPPLLLLHSPVTEKKKSFFDSHSLWLDIEDMLQPAIRRDDKR